MINAPTISILAPNLWPWNTLSNKKEPGLLEEMADSRSEAGTVQMILRNLVISDIKEASIISKRLGSFQKDSGVKVKMLPLTKVGLFELPKNNNCNWL